LIIRRARLENQGLDLRRKGSELREGRHGLDILLSREFIIFELWFV
jgi:hypothetical protein